MSSGIPKGFRRAPPFGLRSWGSGRKNSCLRRSIPILIRLRGEVMPTYRLGEKRISYWTERRKPQKKGSRSSLFTGQEEGSCPGVFRKAFLKRISIRFSSIFPVTESQEVKGEEEIGRYADHVYGFLIASIFGNSSWLAIPWAGPLSRPWPRPIRRSCRGFVLVGTGARLKVMPAVLDGIKRTLRRR